MPSYLFRVVLFEKICITIWHWEFGNTIIPCLSHSECPINWIFEMKLLELNPAITTPEIVQMLNMLSFKCFVGEVKYTLNLVVQKLCSWITRWKQKRLSHYKAYARSLSVCVYVLICSTCHDNADQIHIVLQDFASGTGCNSDL